MDIPGCLGGMDAVNVVLNSGVGLGFEAGDAGTDSADEYLFPGGIKGTDRAPRGYLSITCLRVSSFSFWCMASVCTA